MPARPPTATSGKLFTFSLVLGIFSLLIIPANCLLFYLTTGSRDLPPLTSKMCLPLMVVQLLGGTISGGAALVQYGRARGKERRDNVMALALLSFVVGLGGASAIALWFWAASALGGAWGRPLRLRGRVLHPRLRAGSDWTRGARPDVSALDAPTRAALEALWLHDAQKEHASVPAFSRVSWMLAAVGAPAELLQGAHQAALEEIDHTRRCFALAAGYGGRSHSVEAMPDLLVGGLDLRGDPLAHLALESLKDGCLLEDFNADVAAECEASCQDPVTRDVLGRIAREERSHAELSWAMLRWLLERGGAPVRRAITGAIEGMPSIARPTAASAEKQRLLDQADPTALRAHGRLPDAEWAKLWELRLEATRERALGLLSAEAVLAAA